jgi:hypothetical protein
MRGSSSLLLAILFTATTARPAIGQTTTTNCNAFGNSVNCTSNTRPSANQQFQQNMQALSYIGAALAQQRAEKAARQAAWAAAATEEAKQGAEVARSNFDATSDAISRFTADSLSSSGPAVNMDIPFDWSLIDGVEALTEQKPGSGQLMTLFQRIAFVDNPDGSKVLRIEVTNQASVKNTPVINYVSSIRFQPASGAMIYLEEGQPLFQTISPSYQSAIIVGNHAFSALMNGRGFNVTVPHGVLYSSLLPAAIAAMSGELPDSARIWVLDGLGEVAPVDLRVMGRTVVNEPVGPVNGNCTATAPVKKEKRDAVILGVRMGTIFFADTVLAAAPHLWTSSQLKCRILRK